MQPKVAFVVNNPEKEYCQERVLITKAKQTEKKYSELSVL